MPVLQIPIYRPSASAVKLALIARSHPAPLGDLLRCPTSSSALKSLPYLSTAATRSARFICRRQRSHRSHTVTIPVLQIPIYRAITKSIIPHRNLVMHFWRCAPGGVWGGGLPCGSKALNASPAAFFGYFLGGTRKYRRRQAYPAIYLG